MGDYKSSMEYDLNHSNAGLNLQKKYKIKNEFYRSDMSRLYFVEDKKGRIRLLKIIKISKNVAFDLETAMKLNHESISKIIEHACSERYLYLIKEYVEGVDLEQYVHEKGKLSHKEADVLIKKIGKLLKYLHGFEGKSVVYRDLKPSNIILTPSKNIVLIDIITLRTIKEDKDTDTFYIASRGFSAPEQYGYSQSTAASDIYALGATLYYLLTAKVPNNNESLKSQINHGSGIEDNFAYVILKAMSFNPASRFASVTQMLKALDKNHKGLNKLKILALSVLLFTLVFTAWQYNSAETKENLEKSLALQTLEKNKMVEIDSGLDIYLTQDNYLKISFDRNLMDEALRDFKYYQLDSSVKAFDGDAVSERLFNNTLDKEILETYTNAFYTSVDEALNHICIAIYDKDYKALGYYIYNAIALNDFVHYENPSQVSLEGLALIDSGIDFKYDGEHYAETIIDIKNMPEALNHFKYMSVFSSVEPFEFSNLKNLIYGAVMQNNGMTEYNFRSYGSGVEKDDNLAVLIFDERKKAIGYYLNHDLKSYEALPEEAMDQLLIEDCVSIEIFKDYSHIRIDDSKVPAFSKIAIWSTDKNTLKGKNLEDLRSRVRSGQGVNAYDKDKGAQTGYGPAPSFMAQSWYLVLLDDNFEILREFIINQ